MSFERSLPSWSVLERLVELERFANDGSPTGMTFSRAVDPGNSPRFGSHFVHIPLVELDGEDFDELGPVNAFVLTTEPTTIPLHPDVGPYLSRSALARLQSTRSYLTAQPTAAGRTLLVSEPVPHFIKLAYPGVLGRYSSSLDTLKAKSSIACSNSLVAALETEQVGGARFGILPDVAAQIADIMRDSGSFGHAVCIYREAVICHNSSPGEILGLFPAFSLGARFGAGIEAVRELWSMTQVRDVLTFGWDCLIEPVLSSALHLAMRCGLLPEPHSQNVLLAVKDGAQGVEVLPVWRDPLGFYRDDVLISQRRMTGATSFPTHRSLNDPEVAQQIRSAHLDQMLWEYLLAPMVSSLRALGANDLELIGRIREFVSDATGLEGYLPESGWWARPLESPLPAERIGLTYIPGPSPTRN